MTSLKEIEWYLCNLQMLHVSYLVYYLIYIVCNLILIFFYFSLKMHS